MAISSIFHVPNKLSLAQRNWLAMCKAIPGAKLAFGDKVTDHDVQLAKEAGQILASAK